MGALNFYAAAFFRNCFGFRDNERPTRIICECVCSHENSFRLCHWNNDLCELHAPTRAQLGQTVLKTELRQPLPSAGKIAAAKRIYVLCGTGTSRRQIHSPRAPATTNAYPLAWTVSTSNDFMLTIQAINQRFCDVHAPRPTTVVKTGQFFCHFIFFFNSCEICRRCHLELHLVVRWFPFYGHFSSSLETKKKKYWILSSDL